MKKLLLVAFALVSFQVHSQQVLSLEEALKIVLENNFDIRIAKNQTEIASNNVNIGNAGMAPNIELRGGPTYGVNTYTRQKFANGTEQIKEGAVQQTFVGAVQLSWTLFDGFKMFATYDRLKNLSEAEQLRFRIQVENTVEAMIASYYAVVRQKQSAAAIKEALALLQERIKIAETKMELGNASKLEVLQAKVDYNAEVSEKLKQEQVLEDAKTELNILLARNVSEDFDVTDTIVIDDIDPEALQKIAKEKNLNLLLSLKNIEVAKNSMREVQSLRLPKIDLNGGYSQNLSQSQAGFLLENNTRGYNVGLTASLPLFNGFRTLNAISNSKIAYFSSQLENKSEEIFLDGELRKATTNFKNKFQVLRLEEENFKLAHENINVALLRFKLGTISSLEMREAQRSYLEASNRLVNARYEAKLSETTLKKLSGELVKTNK